MKLSILTITLCSALAIVGCKKKGNTAETGTGTDTASGSATMTASGSATMTASGSSGSAPAGKGELTSATWTKGGKIDAPLAFDRQLWSDDGSGNLQMF